MKYEHTQIGYLIIFTLVAISLLYGFLLIPIQTTQGDFDLFIVATMLFILFAVASFTSLNVKIDETYLRIKFGYGIFRKRFALEEIVSAKVVRNHWYYGWGIRIWFNPFMIIFNVSGFDAIEIKMKNGKVYRIGTDEPQKFEFAINQNLKNI